MGLQLIFCLETNSVSKTDYIYIKQTIEHFYPNYDRSFVRLSPLYMNGKGNYSVPKTQKKINNLISQFKAVESANKNIVIFCFDCDDYDTNSDDKKFLEDAANYCKNNGYIFVWFCKEIESVYLGKRVSDSDKTKEANSFVKNQRIKTIDENQLRMVKYKDKCSNLCSILDKYLLSK